MCRHGCIVPALLSMPNCSEPVDSLRDRCATHLTVACRLAAPCSLPGSFSLSARCASLSFVREMCAVSDPFCPCAPIPCCVRCIDGSHRGRPGIACCGVVPSGRTPPRRLLPVQEALQRGGKTLSTDRLAFREGGGRSLYTMGIAPVSRSRAVGSLLGERVPAVEGESRRAGSLLRSCVSQLPG